MGASEDEPGSIRAKGACGFFQPPPPSGLWEKPGPLRRSGGPTAQGSGRLTGNFPLVLKYLPSWGLPVLKGPLISLGNSGVPLLHPTSGPTQRRLVPKATLGACKPNSGRSLVGVHWPKYR